MINRWGTRMVLIISLCLLFPFNALAATALTDIDNHWAKQSILSLQAGGFIKGYPDNTFRPELPMTRAGFVTVLVSCLGGTKADDTTSSAFSDVKGHWAQAAIDRAVKLGVIVTAEYPNGFAPDNTIKRSEAAAMLVRASGQKPDPGTISFKDAAEINKSLYKDYIKKAVDMGIISGYSDGTFRPFTSLTRGQTCSLMVKLMKNLGKTLPLINDQQNTINPPNDNSTLYKGYVFYEGTTVLQQGTSGSAIYDGTNKIEFTEITSLDPSRFIWNGSNYDFIGERVRLNGVDYTIIDTLWRGSTMKLEIYLRRV